MKPDLKSSPIIAFDGPAASGKGTLASVIASDYGLPFLDTGLLYRAVGHLAHHQDLEPAIAATQITPEILAIEALRGREAGERASQVASLPAVRAALKSFQIVLDGRDIGTVIAPDATLKLFITAAPEIRAHRRWLQLVRDNPTLLESEVLADIHKRDARDSGRSDAPLIMATDALLLDTSNLDIETAIETVRRLVKARCGEP